MLSLTGASRFLGGATEPALSRSARTWAALFRHWEHYLLGLLADLKRKSIEPIALAAGVAVRTLQEFLAFLDWNHERANDVLQRMVADEHGSPRAVGVIDASGHAEQGRKTPGVRRQYCGETGKID